MATFDLARTVHELPDGEQITLMPEQPQTSSTEAGGRLAYAELDVFADYNYFLVQDDSLRPELSDDFTDALIDDLVATEQGVLGVGTARRVTVPVVLEVLASDPADDIDGWDHVTEGGLTAPSGRLVVSSMDYREQIPRTQIAPGDYAARIYYRGFRTISPDGMHGDDLYRVVLWPGQPQPTQVIKRFDGDMPGG